MKPKQFIGVLEMGQASTQLYIRLLNESYSNEQQNNIKQFELIPSDFEKINTLLPKRSIKLDTLIASYLEEIRFNNFKVVLIPNITIHETVDAVINTLEAPVPVAHPLSGTINRLHQAGMDRAILFGSRYTMTSNYIKEVLENAEIAINIPNQEDLEFIDWVRRQVYAESVSAETLKIFNDLVESYSNESTVVLACTEFSLISTIRNERILDMAAIQVEDAISMFEQ